MFDQDLIIARLKDALGYTATDAEAIEVIGLLAIVNASPRLVTVLGDEPATIFIPNGDLAGGIDGDE